MDTEFRELLMGELSDIKDDLKTLDGKITPIAEQQPKIQGELKDVRTTLYHPADGLVKTVTLISDRQTTCLAAKTPGNKSARFANMIGGAALVLSAIALIITTLFQLGGCTPMPKQTTHLNNLEAVDTLKEYSQLKKEITTMVKAIGQNATLELTGDRTYVIEKDGSMFMRYAGRRVSHGHWDAEEWRYFSEDMKHNRLRQRLLALKK